MDDRQHELEQEIIETPAAERVAQKRAAIKAAKEADKNPFLKRISRRSFLRGLAGLAGLAALDAGGSLIFQSKAKSQSESEPLKPAENILNLDLTNKILNADPGSDIRKGLENSYTNEAIASGKLKDIDQAFWFVSNTDDRVRLLEKRGEYRENGKFGLRQLSDAEKKFCEKNNFHEEWVAICIDSHQKTKEILQNKIAETGGMTNFIKVFRPDLEGLVDPNKISLDDLMLPVGALIGIALSESKTITKDGKIHTLVNIGNVPSINHITGEEVKQKERDLFKMLSVNGIKYNSDKVLGSNKTGDIGSVQFRPDTALDFIDFCKKKGIDFTFNPFGLDAVTAACLMLSIGQRVPTGNGEDLRMAYIDAKGSDSPFYSHMIKSFQRWNPSLVDNILEWRNKFS